MEFTDSKLDVFMKVAFVFGLFTVTRAILPSSTAVERVMAVLVGAVFVAPYLYSRYGGRADSEGTAASTAE